MISICANCSRPLGLQVWAFGDLLVCSPNCNARLTRISNGEEPFIDEDGDKWIRGADRDEVILVSPDPAYENNHVRRSELNMYHRWPTKMFDCAHAAFKALWAKEETK